MTNDVQISLKNESKQLRGTELRIEYHEQYIWSKCSGFYRFYDLRLVQV